jgi:methylglyoxal synthase
MPVSIALVAHDRMKPDMVDWAERHAGQLRTCTIYATGKTGTLVKERCPGLDITLLKSGPLGGDQQVGALIAEGRIGALFFFTDPLSALPHDVDVKALTRLSTLYNIPMACNPATADYIISSPLFAPRQSA